MRLPGLVKPTGALLLLALLLWQPPAARGSERLTPAAQGNERLTPAMLSVALGAEFSSGSYGTAQRIQTLYLPLVVTWFPDERWDVGLEIPYLYQSGSGVTTTLYNRGVLNSDGTKVAARGGPGGNSGGSGGAGSVSGLGDILLRVGFIAWAEQSQLPQVRPSLLVKFPTADVSDGLGTGSFDVTVGLEASKWLGAFYLLGEGAYTRQGSASGFDLKDYFSYTAALGYQAGSSLRPMLLLKGATPPSGFSGALLEARARLIWYLSDTASVDVYGARGFTEDSPEYGGGVSASYSF